MRPEQYRAMLTVLSCRYIRDIWPWCQERVYIPDWVFYWNATPGGCIRMRGETVRMTPENFYIVPGNTLYATFAERPFEHLHIHFKPNEWIAPLPGVAVLPCDEAAMAPIREFIGMEGQRGMLMRETLCAYAILSSVLRRLPAERLWMPDRFDGRIEKICALIRDTPERLFSNQELADRVGLSRNAFLQLFRRETGEPPRHYLRRKHIEYAGELLQFSDDTIESIAERSGFRNRYHFTRVFHQVTGFPPAEFRQIAKIRRSMTPPVLPEANTP